MAYFAERKTQSIGTDVEAARQWVALNDFRSTIQDRILLGKYRTPEDLLDIVCRDIAYNYVTLSQAKEQHPSGFLEVVPSANEVNWQNFLGDIKSLDILFAYGKTWRGLFADDTIRILSCPDTKIRVILPNPDNKTLMVCLGQKFHKETGDTRQDIREAVSSFIGYHERAGQRPQALEIWFTNEPLVFSMYRFDDKVVLALYSHRYRQPVPHIIAIKPSFAYNFAINQFSLLTTEENGISKKIYPRSETPSRPSRKTVK
jgi:hypothetical protein